MNLVQAPPRQRRNCWHRRPRDPDPQQLVDTAVHALLGERVTSSCRLGYGTDLVYEVTVASGEVRVVRVAARSPQVAFQAAVSDTGRRHDIPVPWMRYRDVAIDDTQVTVSVESRVPGTPLTALLGSQPLDRRTIETVAERAGVALARLHALDTSQLPSLPTMRTAPDDDVAARIDDLLARTHLTARLARVVSTCFDAVRRYEWLKHDYPKVVLHGDAGPRHVMVDRARFSGFIDMTCTRIGDPTEDLASWDLTGGTALPLGWLMYGYREHAEELPDLPVRLSYHRLVLSLQRTLLTVQYPAIAGATLERLVTELGQELEIFHHAAGGSTR